MPVNSMATDTINWDDLTTTTLRNRSKAVQDQWSRSTALMDKLTTKGRKRTVSGGLTLVEELNYQSNKTVKRYSGYETLNIAPQQHLTAAEFRIRQYAVAVTMSGLEQLINSGQSAVLDLLESRINNAEKSLVQVLAQDLYSDGTADGGKAINGLANLISDTGLGTVGGIDANTWSWWRNQVLSFSGSTLGTPASTNIQTAMNRLYLRLQNGREAPDLIVATNNYWRLYLESLQAQQRFATSDSASAGFTKLRYMGADVVADGPAGAATGNEIGGFAGTYDAADRMYFLNTDYLSWRPHKDRDFTTLDASKHAVNQDAMVKLMVFAGNLTINSRRHQGVLIA